MALRGIPSKTCRQTQSVVSLPRFWISHCPCRDVVAHVEFRLTVRTRRTHIEKSPEFRKEVSLTHLDNVELVMVSQRTI